MGNTVKERLIEYLKYKKVSKSKFGRDIGVSSAYVNSIRSSIDKDKIKSIALKYPDLSIAWLLYGDGNMIKDLSIDEASLIDLVAPIKEYTDEIFNNPPFASEPTKTLSKRDSQIDELISLLKDDFVPMLKKKDEQIDRLITLLEKA